MHKRTNPALVGAFVLGAAALVVVAITLLGSGRLFHRQHLYVLYFQSNVNGLRVGAPVKFRGVEIGSVERILLSLNQLENAVRVDNPSIIRVPVLIEIDERKIVSRGGRSLDLDDPRTLKSLIAAGLRGQLSMESLITGMLYVDLDVFPGTPAHFVLPPNATFQEIPTRQTEFEQVQKQLGEIVARLSKVNFPQLIQSMVAMTDAVRNLANSPQLQEAISQIEITTRTLDRAAQSAQRMADTIRSQVVPLAQSLRGSSEAATQTLRQAQAAMVAAQQAFVEANATFKEAKAVLDPASPITYQLRKTLEDISGAARSTRELADYLSRNPSAILRGRPVSQDGQ
jgi:paraquat-inducible protein B